MFFAQLHPLLCSQDVRQARGILGSCIYLRHLSEEYRLVLSADLLTATRPGRHLSANMLTKIILLSVGQHVI